MKKPSLPSSTWARLSKAYRHKRGDRTGAAGPDEKSAGDANNTGSKSYTESMDSTKQFFDSQEADNGATKPVPAQTGDGSAGSDPAATTDAAASLEAVTAERDRLAIERADLQDRLLRRQAEFDNFRRRAERERADVLEYANSQTGLALLPILDDFERALKVESADTEYARGMELIYQRLLDSLKKLGLEPITSIGEHFDPNVHHAVDSIGRDDVEDHTILEEYQRGYNFRGKQLRPAMVKVAVKKS
jgi:molecular chaperone GrpE